ncbi:PleD family two-component system response regulator, partial [Streptomyces sp. NPDC057654]|uniref:response regulator n=1 Tax=Streptomyces sp. NPDC057654 TaxID=3346196 RepID=UPI0036BCEACF
MAELRPLADDLNGDARALARMLRELFGGLDVSVRRYAARRHRDAGTFSRYLNGTRVPPWEVILDLLTDLAEHCGKAATPVAIEHVRGLHQTAVRNSGSPQHAVELIERQLVDADLVARRTTAHGDVLGDALLDRQHRIADLEVRLSQLEAAWTAERARADAMAEAAPDVDGLLRERDALRADVRKLTGELCEARRLHEAAEERCELLERQLETIEATQQASGSHALIPAPSPAGARGMPKVLVVDDQPDNLLAMNAVLSTLDQEVVAVSSGRDALKALLDHDDFAVIIMDVQMPDMDGYETAAHIKRRNRDRDVPIIFLTAMGADAEHSARGYAAGAVDYIGKPFDPWVLRAKVAVFTGIFLERHVA